MAASPQSAGGRVRASAVVVAVTVHGIVLTSIVWRIGAEPQPVEPPVMNVELYRRPLSHVLSLDDTRRPTPPTRQTAPVRHDLPAPVPAIGDPAALLPTPTAPPGAQATGLSRVLRGLVGCDHADLLGLTAEERERCREQLAARDAGAASSSRLNLDVRRAYGRDPTPYLIRKSKNGCKIAAAGDKAPSGDDGAAAGVGCALSF